MNYIATLLSLEQPQLVPEAQQCPQRARLTQDQTTTCGVARSSGGSVTCKQL